MDKPRGKRSKFNVFECYLIIGSGLHIPPHGYAFQTLQARGITLAVHHNEQAHGEIIKMAGVKI